MAPSIATQSQASHREELAAVRPQMLKVGGPTQVEASRLRELAAEAIRATSGNARAAAIDLQIHEAHLSRQLKDGTLRIEQLEVLGAPLLAKLGEELTRVYGPLASPQARAKQRLREARAILDEIEQLVEHVA